jgi:DNA-binding Lrp family transcriptional regulator
MDNIDRRLIALLRHDARRSISSLAAELRVSRATVRARMARLEQAGEILGYAAVLRGEGDLSVRGIMLITIEGRSADRVVTGLAGFSEVVAVHTTNGQWDLVVELGTADLPAFDAILRRIRLLPGIANSETNLLLATLRETRRSTA